MFHWDNDLVIYARDSAGKAHFLAKFYAFSGDYYHSTAQVPGKYHSIRHDNFGGALQIAGEPICRPTRFDLMSCFWGLPTDPLRDLLSGAHLQPEDVAKIVVFCMKRKVGFPTRFYWQTFTPQGIQCTDFDAGTLPEPVFMTGVEVLTNAIMENGVAEMTSLIQSYFPDYQPPEDAPTGREVLA